MNAAPDSCYLRIDLEDYPQTRQNLRDKGITDSLEIENLLTNLKKTKCIRMFCNKHGDTKRIEYTRHYLGLAAEGYLFLLDGSNAYEYEKEHGNRGVDDAVAYSDSVLFTISAGATGSASFSPQEKQALRSKKQQK